MEQSDRIRIQWAYDIAKHWHKGQERDDGQRYFNHVRAVAQILIDHGHTSADYLTIAILHDVLEDTYMPLTLLEKVFGPEISRAIWSVSKIVGVEDPISGRIHKLPPKSKEEYFEGIKLYGRRAALAKCADRIHNLSDLVHVQPEGSRWTPEKRLKQVAETREWILPLAEMYEPRFAEKLIHLCEMIELDVKHSQENKDQG